MNLTNVQRGFHTAFEILRSLGEGSVSARVTIWSPVKEIAIIELGTEKWNLP